MDTTKDQILESLKKQIDGFKAGVHTEKVGHVLEVGDGIARILGLNDIGSQEMIEFEGGEMGVVLNLEEDNVGAIILGSENEKVRESVKTIKKIYKYYCPATPWSICIINIDYSFLHYKIIINIIKSATPYALHDK